MKSKSSEKMKPRIIAVDFDGTVVTHEFPKVGYDIGATFTLLKLVEAGHKLILWTMRSNVENPKSDDPSIIPLAGNYLDDAVAWFKHRKIPLWGLNKNPDQSTWTHSPKAFANLYIDDAAIGTPLTLDPDLCDRPFVNWSEVCGLLMQEGYFK